MNDPTSVRQHWMHPSQSPEFEYRLSDGYWGAVECSWAGKEVCEVAEGRPCILGWLSPLEDFKMGFLYLSTIDFWGWVVLWGGAVLGTWRWWAASLASVHSMPTGVRACSVVSNSATPWTVARQAPSVLGILQARILEWVAIFLLQGIFLTQGWRPHLLHCQVNFLPRNHLGSPLNANSIY